MASKLHPHRRRRSQRLPSPVSEESTSIESENDDAPATTRRHLTTPRTKRRSITQLNELVRRQKEQHRADAEQAAIGKQIESKMESLLGHQGPTTSSNVAAERLIQVAVRCRPRTSSRLTRRRHSERELGDSSDDDEGDEDLDDDAAPQDGIIEYEIPQETETMALPSISVPSHVLALGGHGPRRRFDFDFVFPPHKEQREIYDACVHDAIQGVLRSACESDLAVESSGAHATIVAYGQTGTGKTYTMGMLQHADPTTQDREHGIIPRAIIHILSRITAFNRSADSQKHGVRLVVAISFLQIYLENIQDLLAPAGRRASHLVAQSHTDRRSSVSTNGHSGGLQVRLNPTTNVFYVPGLSEFSIEHVDDARALLERAAHNRVLAATARNKTSSRSHTLLTISIRQQRMDGVEAADESGDRGTNAPRATVSFVDLAGSERVEGALHFLHATRKRQELRIREAKFINRSLSALGSVIAALAAQDGRHRHARHRSKPHASPRGEPSGTSTGLSLPRSSAPHIRFRDSQLTKLLQSRLMKGNGRLVLIATVDDRPSNLTETLSTLKFASQCRRVDLSQRHSKTEMLRKQQEESLLKQVFAEVKAMYEEREAALEREHAARITALEEQLLRMRNAATAQTAASPRRNAPYVALCSLADIARRHGGDTTAPHPSAESFVEESELVKYTAELYREVKTAMLPSDSGGRSPGKATRKSLPGVSSTMSVSKSGENSRGSVISDVVIARPSAPTRDVAGVRPATTTVEHSPPVDDDEFQAIARSLFASGVLQIFELSSDEDTAEPFSQLA